MYSCITFLGFNPRLRRISADERLGDVDDRQVETGLLQVGAAAGRVRHDRLDAGRFERLRRSAGELVPLLAPSRVQCERAAAAGVRRRHLVAVGGEHPRRGAVDLAEEHRLDTAREQPDPGKALADGRCLGGRRDGLAPPRGERLQRLERPRCRQRGETEGEAETPRVREDGEDRRPEQPVTPAAAAPPARPSRVRARSAGRTSRRRGTR